MLHYTPHMLHYTPAAAFPLLASAASPNAQVADAAIATLERVCAACGYASLRYARVSKSLLTCFRSLLVYHRVLFGISFDILQVSFDIS